MSIIGSIHKSIFLSFVVGLFFCSIASFHSAAHARSEYGAQPQRHVLAPRHMTGHDTLMRAISVREFGAVGDGVADDTDALNIALAKGGRIVFEPKRQYRVGKRLYITKSGTEINLNGSSIVCDGGMILNAAPDSTAKKYGGVSDVFIHNGELKGISVGLIHGNNIKIHKISFKNINGDHSIQICACNNINITECRFSGLKSKGEKPHYEHINIDPCNRTAFPYFKKDSPIYDGTKNKNINVICCTFSRGAGEYDHFDTAIGIHYDDGLGNLHENVRVANCRIDSVAKWGVRLNACQNSVVENCTITTQLYAFNTGHAGIRSKNITFRNNNIRILNNDKKRPVNIGPYRTEGFSLYGNTFNNAVGRTEPLIYFNALADDAKQITYQRLQRSPVLNKIAGDKVTTLMPLTQLNKLYLEVGHGHNGKNNLVVIQSMGKTFRIGETLSVMALSSGFTGFITIKDDHAFIIKGLKPKLNQVYGAVDN